MTSFSITFFVIFVVAKMNKVNSMRYFSICFLIDPFSLILFPGVNSRSARVLFLLVAPGHLVFLYAINSMQGGHTTLTSIFIAFYMAAALLQVYAINLCFSSIGAQHLQKTSKENNLFIEFSVQISHFQYIDHSLVNQFVTK